MSMKQDNVSSAVASKRRKAKPAFGRKKNTTKFDLFFDRHSDSAEAPRSPVPFSPGFMARHMVPIRVGENGHSVVSVSELCGFLRNGNASVIGVKKMVEVEMKRGKHMRIVTREVIDPGHQCDIVVFTNMTTPHCYALKSQVKSGL